MEFLKGGKERMMAPSVGQRNLNANESNDYITDKVDSNGKSNSRCSSMSDGESYECYGEVEMDTSLSGHINGSGETRLSNGNSLKRNTWLRTSLKRSSKQSLGFRSIYFIPVPRKVHHDSSSCLLLVPPTPWTTMTPSLI
ncbi:unnamed protein product [Nezara viridula]|uniref:Uncharacterized protein n=1 Tax=Nezara viridula TaxID=85310 RepID=A0A9P0HC02_NEZVI|nr:unnamed protein product [Nezara viridula]